MKPETALEVGGTPQQFITQAIQQNLSVDHLERLMALQERWQANQAKMAYVEAMKSFQAECPIIEKRKKVFEKGSTTKVRYQYAPLDSIVEQIKSLIAKYGLSYSFRTTNNEKDIIATLRITHVLGHTEENSFVVPIGTEDYMSAVQKYGARRTFAERYAFCDGFGILTGDEDTDATKETIQDEPQEKYNTNTGEIHPKPQTVTKNGKDVSFKVFDPKVEQIAFGKYSGMEWITLDKGYLEWIVKNGQPDSKQKAEATLKYLENGQSQVEVKDDLDAVFGKKEPETLAINDTEKKTKALIAIGKATSEAKLDSVVRTAAGYFDAGELTEETHKEILEMVETRRKTIGGKK